ncbi:MAG: ribosome-associated translation inhibitor RaiA [Clostridiales bacterium]|nr:ribosome-associated translation inhibitor RaiA [Clostridiales bacterium]
MKTTVKGRSFEVTPALKDYLEKRLSKFDKLMDIDEAVVVLQVNKDRHKAEVTLLAGSRILRGEQEGYDMYACIDNVAEKLENQFGKYKSRLRKRARGSKAQAAPVFEALAEDAVIRTKTFSLKPMSAEEAVMQMNLLGHSFFAFTNEESNQVNVVYQRKDGAFGLLEPEK